MDCVAEVYRSLRAALERKRNAKTGAMAGNADDFNGSTMRLGDTPGKVEPQAGSRYRRSACRAGPVATFEDSGLLMSRNTTARIGDREYRLALMSAEIYVDPPFGSSELDSIVEQVEDQPP